MNSVKNTTDHGNRHYRSNLLFSAGSVAILTGLLMPGGEILADVLLAFCVFVGAAIGAISLSDVRSRDLKGFAGMGMIAAIIRIFTSVVVVKLSLTGPGIGLVAEKAALPLQASSILSIIVIGALLLALAGLTLQRSGLTDRLRSEYFDKILKAKQIFIASAVRNDLFCQDHADKLEEEFGKFSSFFSTINACTRLTFCETAIELCVFVLGIAGAIIVSVAGNAPPFSMLTNTTELAVAIALLAGLAYLSNVSMASISKKYFEAAKTFEQTPTPKPVQRRKVNSTIANEDSDQHVIDSLTETATPEEIAYANVQDTEWHVGNEQTLWRSRDLQNSESYRTVAQIMQGRSFDEEKIILIASDRINCLPVTVPVNIAVELTQAGLTCLIVDLDLKREAMSHVFEITRSDYAAGKFIVDTGLEGISLICADLTGRLKPDKAIRLIESCSRKYDRVIVYAPDIKVAGRVEQISGCCKSAMLFGENNPNENMSQLRKTLEGTGCDIIERDEVLIEVWS